LAVFLQPESVQLPVQLPVRLLLALVRLPEQVLSQPGLVLPLELVLEQPVQLSALPQMLVPDQEQARVPALLSALESYQALEPILLR
jgi:hypothetical protein